jgi:hypothetical protein
MNARGARTPRWRGRGHGRRDVVHTAVTAVALLTVSGCKRAVLLQSPVW